MTTEEYTKLALRTAKTPEFMQNLQMSELMHGLMGICTEAGEAQDMVKKHLIYNKPFDAVNILEECGDLLWYIVLTLHSLGYTLNDAMERNISKLEKRYGGKFSTDKAVNRDLEQERQALEGK